MISQITGHCRINKSCARRVTTTPPTHPAQVTTAAHVRLKRGEMAASSHLRSSADSGAACGKQQRKRISSACRTRIRKSHHAHEHGCTDACETHAPRTRTQRNTRRASAREADTARQATHTHTGARRVHHIRMHGTHPGARPHVARQIVRHHRQRLASTNSGQDRQSQNGNEHDKHNRTAEKTNQERGCGALASGTHNGMRSHTQLLASHTSNQIAEQQHRDWKHTRLSASGRLKRMFAEIAPVSDLTHTKPDTNRTT